MSLPCLPRTFRDCPDCGRRYDRSWTPRSGYTKGSPPRHDGATYCRPCQYKRTSKCLAKRDRGTCRCDGCGKPYAPTRQKVSDTSNGRRLGGWFCSLECFQESSRIYADERERAREYKRRQRAGRHAKGLRSDGKPYVGSDALRAHAASRYVQPTITAHLENA